MDKTPGQCCYEAYIAAVQAHVQPLWPPFAWEVLGPVAQAAWEAAAQAVLAFSAPSGTAPQDTCSAARRPWP